MHVTRRDRALPIPHANPNAKAPASRAEADALAFADAWISYATEQMQEHGTDFPPTVHFLPGGLGRRQPFGKALGESVTLRPWQPSLGCVTLLACVRVLVHPPTHPPTCHM